MNIAEHILVGIYVHAWIRIFLQDVTHIAVTHLLHQVEVCNWRTRKPGSRTSIISAYQQTSGSKSGGLRNFASWWRWCVTVAEDR